MDEIAESIGKLSTTAKEWVPGRGSVTGKNLLPNADAFVPKNQPTTSNVAPPPTHRVNLGTSSSSDAYPGYSVKSAMGSVPLKSTFNTPSIPHEDMSVQSPVAILPPPKRSSYVSTNNIHVASAPPPPRSLPSLGSSPLNHSLWKLYRQRSQLIAQSMAPDDPRYKALPPNFTNAYPLDPPTMSRSSTRSSFGYPTASFKVVSVDDGRIYCLRRIDNVKCVNNSIALAISQAWNSATFRTTMDLENEEDMAKIQSSFHRRGKLNEGKQMNVVQHPGIVRLYKCWYHSQNRAVFFLYEYYAGAVTLAEWTRLQLEGNAANFIAIPESILWSILTQLVSAVRAVHRGKLACRTLELQHILVTPDIASGVRSDVPMDATNDASSLALATKRVRVRINCVGVMDALEYEARKQLIDLQKKDLKDLGHILLSLATGSPKFMEYSVMLQYESFMRQNYSSRLCDITKALLTLDFAEVPTIDHVCRWLTEYTFDELDTYHSLTDSMEEALAAEYDSSRVLRLMMKLAFVNERPEFGVDSRWSETGDNYVLKLFRDYVFHQADSQGRPVMDLGHVVTALNKLDMADEEKIVLTSRDGKTLMIVSFADVARCLEASYGELCQASISYPTTFNS